MTKEEYRRLNFRCKRLINECKKNGVVYPNTEQDDDRCKYMVKIGYLKPIRGSWSGEVIGYNL